MGNTPSNQASPARARPNGSSPNPANAAPSSSTTTTSTSPNPAPNPHSRHPGLRLPMPSRPTHISPQTSNPTSPSGRGTSPRRRKSLELPDLNRLTFTPAAPVPTTATHTSHHFAPSTPAAGHVKNDSISNNTNTANTSSPAPSTSGRWKAALGGKASPLANPNALGAMSKLDNTVPAPRTSSPSRLKEVTNNPYFPAGNSNEVSPSRERGRHASPRRSMDNQGQSAQPSRSTPLPPVIDSPVDVTQESEIKDGMVSVPIQWTGGGKVVYVTGNFADQWKGRIKLRKSTHDFNTILRLAPGQYRLKFIVDDSWRCSKQISTATDDDGTLVNWIEVEAPKSEEDMKSEWSTDQSISKSDDADDSQWTSIIPPPLALYQYLEELPHTYTPEQFTAQFSHVPHLSSVPQPPTLPRILDKVIVNVEAKKLVDDSVGNTAMVPAGLDDNSILAVPNHVVLNHLTASAIKNGTLGVGTTTRYRKKYITTMFFKPTLADLMGDLPPVGGVPTLGEEIPAAGR